MGEQIEMLEHHADLSANVGNIFEIVRQRNSIHNNVAALVFFQTIDAANQGRLSGPGRSADYDPFAAFHR